MQGVFNFEELPEEIDLDGCIEKGVRYYGSARRQLNGKYRVLADVQGCLCLVEVSIRREAE